MSRSKLVDIVVPRSVIAGSLGRYPSNAAGIDIMRRVESLANPASTRTDFAAMGNVPSQPAKSSADRS